MTDWLRDSCKVFLKKSWRKPLNEKKKKNQVTQAPDHKYHESTEFLRLGRFSWSFHPTPSSNPDPFNCSRKKD